ncbi:MAG: TonB-dependent receptor plug domain-containing protein [Terricaulis sp.]
MQNNSAVVDSITSEDIGSFPDTSISEALSRVPGIDTQGFGAAPEAESITNVQTRGGR